jgi:hypothetical protein
MDVRSYRLWLRDEFTFRCTYCLVRERWGRLTGEFDLDHFVPHAENPSEPPVYENLVYVCHACNLRKHDQRLPELALTRENVRIYENGQMVGLTPDADRVIRVLWLNTPQSIQWRRLWIRIVQLAEGHDPEQYRALMAYPDDLPDLSRLRPPSNSKPEGVDQSYHALRQRGELATTYLF